MPLSPATIWQKIKEEGLSALVMRRAFWYAELIKDRFSRGNARTF